jgi:hypothetical protein
VVPVALHSALAIASSVFIFPTSVAAQYTTGLRAVISPLNASFRQHLSLLEIPTTSQEFSPKAVRTSASKAEGALAPLAASARLLARDISWGRFSGKDLDGMREKVQRLVMRAHGMNVYFSLTDPTRERFPVTPNPSRPGSPAAGTPNVSRPSSPSRTEGPPSASPALAPRSTAGCSHVEVGEHRGRPVTQRHPHFEVHCPSHSVKSHFYGTLFRRHHQRHSYVSLLSGVHNHDHLREHVVGVFESQRYLDLESQHFAHPLAACYTERSTALLRQSCEPLLRECSSCLDQLDMWLCTSRHDHWIFWLGGNKCSRIQQERLDELYRVSNELTRTLKEFRTSLRFVGSASEALLTSYDCYRHIILEPYREAFGDKHEGCMTGGDIPPHRFLFHAYTYQYHLMEFSNVLISTVRSTLRSSFYLKYLCQLEYITELEKERLRTRFWLPTISFHDFFRWSIWDTNVNPEREDDENPSSFRKLHTYPRMTDPRQISYRERKDSVLTSAWLNDATRMHSPQEIYSKRL